MLNFLRTDIFLVIVLIVNIILFAMVIISNKRIKNINQKNNEFMRKLGNGKDISEDLNRYMDRIIDLESGLSETNMYCKNLKKDMKKCVQKVGIVRYNAYKDAGNDLSFAVALLDEKNNGVVFNGIYSREMSNIYAKPIVDGKSEFSMSEEENLAVLKAIDNDNF